MENSKTLFRAQEIMAAYDDFLPFALAKECALVAANLVREIYHYESDFWDEVKEIIEHGTKDELIVSDKPDVYEES